MRLAIQVQAGPPPSAQLQPPPSDLLQMVSARDVHGNSYDLRFRFEINQ